MLRVGIRQESANLLLKRAHQTTLLLEATVDEMAHARDEYGARLITERISLPYRAFFDAMSTERLNSFLELKPCHRVDGITCLHGGVDLAGGIGPSDVETCV